MSVRMILLMFVPIILSACSSLASSGPSLPTPEVTCRTTLDWKGIVPGKSTRQEVLRILGKPSHNGSERFVDGRVSFYAYPVEGGKVADLIEDRVFFRKDGIVNWIEVIVADRDGQVHTIQEIVDQLGATLDQVYVNNNFRNPDQYDVLAGPDQIYVWSECGLAVSAYSPFLRDDRPTSTGLALRHPVHPDDTLQPSPSVNGVILFEFFFPPTSYAGFEGSFENKVPFYDEVWHEYLRRIEQ